MNKRDYNLEFENRGSYLYVKLTGRDSFKSSLEYWSKIGAKTLELGHQKVFVHENLDGELTEAEIYHIVTKFKEVGLLGIQIAFFDENFTEASINAFGELVASNRGANVKIFQSLEEAQRWIEKES